VAKAAALGYDMLLKYCRKKSLPFKEDGVLQVATYERAIDTLGKYLQWGFSNGLKKEELVLLDKNQVLQLEPNVRCLSAIYCKKDGSVDYGSIAKQLAYDASAFGCQVLTGTKVYRIDRKDGRLIIHCRDKEIITDYVINAAGGNAIDIAHKLTNGTEYSDMHFRGEYWLAPEQYNDLTKSSIYTVPKYPEYPFLDPHWILRVDGKREIGPNAVPVFGPYAYKWSQNIKDFLPKIFESSKTRALSKIVVDRQFIALAGNEIRSSFSKSAMIARVKEFLPQINKALFTQRGTAGIRSVVIDRNGKFVNDMIMINQNRALHILNYNSPGATGALPVAANISYELANQGIINSDFSKTRSLWNAKEIEENIIADILPFPKES